MLSRRLLRPPSGPLNCEPTVRLSAGKHEGAPQEAGRIGSAQLQSKQDFSSAAPYCFPIWRLLNYANTTVGVFTEILLQIVYCCFDALQTPNIRVGNEAVFL